MYFFICKVNNMAFGLFITIGPKYTCYSQIVDITRIYFVNTKSAKFFNYIIVIVDWNVATPRKIGIKTFNIVFFQKILWLWNIKVRKHRTRVRVQIASTR